MVIWDSSFEAKIIFPLAAFLFYFIATEGNTGRNFAMKIVVCEVKVIVCKKNHLGLVNGKFKLSLVSLLFFQIGCYLTFQQMFK